MPSLSRTNLLFALFLIAVSAFYFNGVPDVPFHPDESTNIFNSADADLFWQNPAQLFWQPDNTADLRQRYRLLDVPVTRNVIAVGRWIAGEPANPEDWDWGLTWDANAERGALPSRGLLLAGRYAIAALFPLSLAFFFFAAKKACDTTTAWLAVLLLATNALVLLHTRRAMAEGGLLLGTTLVMWSLVHAVKRPWLTGIPTALAFSAKYTLAALAPVGFLAALWQPGASRKRRAGHALAYCGLFLLTAALLHPVYWQRPIPALQAAAQTRMDLAAAQTSDHEGFALTTPDRKLIGMIGALYITPPLFAEVGNYTDETYASEEAYLANPLHTLFRSLPGGALMLVLTLFGWVAAARSLFAAPGKIGSSETEPEAKIKRRSLGLLLAAALFQAGAIYVLVPLAWQRYYLPLVPFACLWIAYGCITIIRSAISLAGPAGRARRAAHLPEK